MVMISPLQNLYNLRMARALPPAGGAGLSSLPPGPEAVLPAQSPDAIDDGIKTLMAYGRQATGQGLDSLISPTGMPVRRMSDGGSTDDADSMDSGAGSMGGVSDFGGGYENEYGAMDPTPGYDDPGGLQGAVDASAQSSGNYGIDYTKDYGALDPTPAKDDPGGLEGELVADLGFLGSITKKDLTPENIAITVAKAAPTLLGLPNPVGLLSAAKTLGRVATALGVPGKTQTAAEAIAEQEAMSVGAGDGDPWIRPYGDPYNAPKPVVSEPTPTEPDSFFRRQAPMPLTLADIVGYATGQPGYEGGFPRFLPPVVAAQGGGISALAYGGDTAPTGYGNPAFEGMVPGTGTGMSDSVPFSIEGQQPALLSRDEYVLPADVVSQLGDGSSGAGADMLNNFVSQVRHSKYGQTQQPPANGGGLMSALMRHGGIV